MAGQGTVGLEILEDVPDADVVLVQVGGGGLVSGIATAVKGLKPGRARGRDRARAVARAAREPEGGRARDRRGEVDRGRPQRALRGRATASRSALELGVESVLVTEEALEEAFRFMYGRMKLACEVAGAATAAALCSPARSRSERGQTVAAVVSGGNVAPKTAAAILASDEA